MIQRAIGSFHPAKQPWGTRRAYRRELVTAGTFPVAAAMLEGGVMGVLGKTIFDVSNFGFAMINAAPMFANLTSLFWTRWSAGRRKAPFVGMLMSGLLVLVAAVAVLPTAPDDGGHRNWGAFALVMITVVGRCLMAGVVTVRSAMWRLNYARSVRAKITGKLVLIATLILTLVPIGVGLMVDWRPGAFRVIFPAAAVLGVVGVAAFARIRVRQERQLLRSEREPHADAELPRRGDGRPHNFVSVLREDADFRAYMTWQFFAGVSNMMGYTAFGLFVIQSIEGRRDENTLGMLINAVVPLAVATATVPLWSRLLDRMHIARYRIPHGLTWVFGQAACYGAAVGGQLWMLFLPATLHGLMRGGGMIAWQLGHNDFADKRLAALYMGIHQTLTGVRGAFAPFVGVWLLAGWEGFRWWGGDVPPWEGIGAQVFIITTLCAVVAWLGFWNLSRKLRAQGGGDASDG
ncbi:MAG: MFS transporter [Planctomycetota bacterium]